MFDRILFLQRNQFCIIYISKIQSFIKPKYQSEVGYEE